MESNLLTPSLKQNNSRFTHFVSLKIENEELKNTIATLQNEFISELEDETFSKRCLIPLHSLHMSLNILRVEEDEMLEEFCNQISSLENMWREPLKVQFGDKLHHFRYQVICLKPENEISPLKDLYDRIQKICEEIGIQNEQDRFDPHLTVCKASRTRGKHRKFFKKHVKKLLGSMQYEFNIDEVLHDHVSQLDICSMKKGQNDEYYEIIKRIPLCC